MSAWLHLHPPLGGRHFLFSALGVDGCPEVKEQLEAAAKQTSREVWVQGHRVAVENWYEWEGFKYH